MKLWMPVAAVLALAVTAGADDIGKKVVDPVSKKQITVAKETPFVYVFLDKLYFTDAKNRDTFLKAPENYIAKTSCPVKGFPVKANKANRFVVNDHILYFCCNNCPEAFKKEPGNFLAMANDPVSGKEFAISADSPKTENGSVIYFFENAENKAAFDKDPAKYAKVKVQ